MRKVTPKRVWKKRTQRAKEKYPDFEEKIGGDIQIRTGVIKYLFDCSIGPDLTYHLATNPADLKKANELAGYQLYDFLEELKWDIRFQKYGIKHKIKKKVGKVEVVENKISWFDSKFVNSPVENVDA